MFSRVVVVQDDFDDLVVREDLGMGVGAVDGGVRGEVPGTEDGVERGDFWADVGYVGEEGVVLWRKLAVRSWGGKGGTYGTVTEIIHLDGEFDDEVGVFQEFFAVCWDEQHIVEGIEFVDQGRCW
jgi:hypothetical protein